MSPNPMINVLHPIGSMPAQNPLAGVLNSLRCASDPLALLQNMALSQPEMQTAMNLIQQNGNNAQQAFYSEAQRRGVDPMAVLQQAQSMMMK